MLMTGIAVITHVEYTELSSIVGRTGQVPVKPNGNKLGVIIRKIRTAVHLLLQEVTSTPH